MAASQYRENWKARPVLNSCSVASLSHNSHSDGQHCGSIQEQEANGEYTYKQHHGPGQCLSGLNGILNLTLNRNGTFTVRVEEFKSYVSGECVPAYELAHLTGYQPDTRKSGKAEFVPLRVHFAVSHCWLGLSSLATHLHGAS